ncbi:hypothetical protein [Kamptonema formosum]|uniref:hypothetical protein n=1 Tax=Kamptonema formosum TaxID=331992 RepID=UPI00034A91C0|nr:hypothetical protein [Oscillatoria sp. PCC 10802]
MSEAITPANPSYDAKQLTEDISAGIVPAPEIDVAADYQASKAYSTGLDAEAAAAATAPQFELPQPEAKKLNTQPTGNPDDFRSMAQDLIPPAPAATVSDEILRKALDLGPPAQ